MKVLFLTPHYIDVDGGGSYASLSYINAFAKIADEVTLFYPYRGKEVITSLPDNVIAFPVADKRKLLSKIWGVLRGRSHRYENIFKVIKVEKFDLIVFDTSITSARLIRKFKVLGKRVITIHHNYQCEYLKDNVKFPFKSLSIYWCAKFEREAVRLSDLNLTLTEDDVNLLREHYGRGGEKFMVLGTFEHKEECITPSKNVYEDRFIITGNLGAIQTERSLIPWLNEYYDELKKVFPGASLVLAGRAPSKHLCDVATMKNVGIIPNPVSMASVLENAKYYICATSLGGGLKLRVMDGLKSGLPVICHKVSARGYEKLVEKGMIYVYSDIPTFRTALNNLKNSSWNKTDIIGQYKESFAFEKGVERLREILSSSL